MCPLDPSDPLALARRSKEITESWASDENSPCRELAEVDVEALAGWIGAISFEEWPQQHRIDNQLRPAMVTDLTWHRFGDATDLIVRHLLPLVAAFLNEKVAKVEAYNRMLSVVMPQHSIHEHADEQPPEWITRVHVPLATNRAAAMRFGDALFHLELGKAYCVDTRAYHAVSNFSAEPRIHLMFDVRRR